MKSPASCSALPHQQHSLCLRSSKSGADAQGGGSQEHRAATAHTCPPCPGHCPKAGKRSGKIKALVTSFISHPRRASDGSGSRSIWSSRRWDRRQGWRQGNSVGLSRRQGRSENQKQATAYIQGVLQGGRLPVAQV